MRKAQITPYCEVAPFVDVALEDEVYEAEKHLLLGTKTSRIKSTRLQHISPERISDPSIRKP